MRRGPQLFYERMRTATGFGLNVEEVQVTRVVKGTGSQADEEGYTSLLDESSNVLDWSNSSMLAFVSLFYVSVLTKSTKTNAEAFGKDLALGETVHTERSVVATRPPSPRAICSSIRYRTDAMGDRKRRPTGTRRFARWSRIRKGKAYISEGIHKLVVVESYLVRTWGRHHFL